MTALFQKTQLQFRKQSGLIVSVIATAFAVLAFDLYLPADYSMSLFYYPVVAGICWYLNIELACAYVAIVVSLNILVALYSGHDQLWTYLETGVVLLLFTSVLRLLKQSQVDMKRISQVDALTGLENSTSFLNHAAQELNRSRRKLSPITVIFLDCDDFKKVNDQYGHLAGDQLLCSIAELLVQHTRNYDIVARWGGDEFAVLLPETDAVQARIVAQRLNACLNEYFAQQQRNCTFSIGVVTFRELPDSEKALVHRADEAMYHAKKQGKNLIYFTTINEPTDPEPPALPMLDSRQITSPDS